MIEIRGYDAWKLMTPEQDAARTQRRRGLGVAGRTQPIDRTKVTIACRWCKEEAVKEAWEGSYCSRECKDEYLAQYD